MLFVVSVLSGCGGAALRSTAKDGAVDQKRSTDAAPAALADGNDLVQIQAADVPLETSGSDLTATDVAETVADTASGTDVLDAAADAAPDAGCPPSFTLCCGMCLPPNAGICAPCDSGGQDAALDSASALIDSAPLDASFRCGDASCPVDQFCLTMSGGPAPRCLPHPDGGDCPPGTQAGCDTTYGYAAGCLETLSWTSCHPLPASCSSGDPCTCFCGAPGSGAGCNRAGQMIYCGLP